MSELSTIFESLKHKLGNKENKDLANNTIALTVLNGFNFILPLFTIPFLLNRLGAEAFGIVNIYIALYAIFQKVVDYGFNFVGTRNISTSENEDNRNVTFTAIIICKTTNAIVVILVSILYFFVAEPANSLVAIIISVELLGTAINMNWLFQGLKKMQIITIITSVTKIIYSILIFLLIRDSEDILIYALLYTFISVA